MREVFIFITKILLLGGSIYLNNFLQVRPTLKFLQNVVESSLGLATSLLILNLTYTIIRWIYIRRREDKSGNDNVIIGVRNIFIIFSAVAVVIAMFGFFGIDLRTLLSTLSIVAAAIALITKEFIIDLMVGIYMGFSSDYEIGDYVKIGETRGKILEIGLFKLKLVNDDDDVVLFSNARVYAAEVINYTQRDIRLMSIDFEIDISRISSIDQLERELVHSLLGFREYIEPGSYALKIVEVKKDCLDLKFQYHLKELGTDMHKSIRRKTVRQVFSSITRRDNEKGAAGTD
jgi:MscS family membrane protein